MISDFLCICSEGVHVSWLVWSYTMGIMFSWAPPLSGPDCPFGDSQCGWVLMVDVSSSTQRLTFCLVLICDIRNNIDQPVKSKSKKSLLSSVLALRPNFTPIVVGANFDELHIKLPKLGVRSCVLHAQLQLERDVPNTHFNGLDFSTRAHWWICGTGLKGSRFMLNKV